MGDEKLKSSVLQVPVSCVLQYARAELMKLTVFRQSPHFAKYTADSTSTTSSSSSSTVATVCSCACCHAFAVPIAIKRIKFEQLLLIGDSLFLRPFSQEGKVRTFELVCAQESPLTPAYSYLYQVTSRATLLAIHCHDLWLDQNTEDLIEDTDKEMSNQITLMEATVEELSQQLDGCYRAYNQIILSHSPVKSTSVGIQAIPVPCVYDISHFYTLEGITHMSSSATTATSTYTPTALVKTLQSDGVFPQLTECVALIACSTDDSISKDIYLESPAWTQDSQLVL